MTGNLTSADPFESLDAMKARHKELLRTSEKEITVETVRSRVCEFLARGTATGLVLDDPGERRVAQGLIDYWKATLYTQLRGDLEPPAPCPTMTVLADFPEEDSEKLVADAEGAVVALAPEDRDVARRILERLVRLEPAVREFHSVPVSRAALDELGNVGQVVRVTHALEKAGVIRSSVAPTGEAQVELTAAHFVRTWPRYADWLKDRLAFRAAAYLWQQRDRHSSGLMAGLPLAKAAGYRDLDALEGEYLSASRASAERTRKVRQWWWFGLSLTLIALFALLWIQEMSRSSTEKLRREQEIASGKAEEAFTARKKELKAEVERLEREQKQLKLEQKQKAAQVASIARMIRALSDIVVADKEDYEELAKWRWEQLLASLDKEDEIRKVLDSKETQRDLEDLKAEGNRAKQGRAALNIAHAVRNQSLAKDDKTINAMMLTIRKDTYETAKMVIEKLVKEYDEAWNTMKELDRESAYEREFWRLYWGPLGMVESNRVEWAMIKFGNALKTARDKFKSKPAKWENPIADLKRAHQDLIAALDDDLNRPMERHQPQKR